MQNTGNMNTGDWTTGHRNTGESNTGDWNTGYSNTGYSNTGDRNTGNSNTGNWNSGNNNSGYINSITPEYCFIFNKPAKRADWDNVDTPNWIYVNLTKWVYDRDMTNKEKEAYPSYITTGGYLKCYSSLKEAYIEAWSNADKEDRERTFKLPNYDVEVFKEVFGFTPDMAIKRKIVIDGKEIELSEESFNELKKSLLKG